MCSAGGSNARALPVSSRRPIAEVAYARGFAGQAHLTRSVKRRFGATPGELRLGRSKPERGAARRALRDGPARKPRRRASLAGVQAQPAHKPSPHLTRRQRDQAKLRFIREIMSPAAAASSPQDEESRHAGPPERRL